MILSRAWLWGGMGVLGAMAAYAAEPRILLAGFEHGALVSGNQSPGWRVEDVRKIAVLTEEGGDLQGRFGRFFFAAGGVSERSAYLRYRLRRRFLTTGTSVLPEPPVPNAMVFRLRLPRDSRLFCGPEGRPTLGVWTYHFDPSDLSVGGANGTSGTTDSMMHGYANFCVEPEAASRWIEVVFAPSAFRQQRDYYHWFAARGVTGRLPFVASLREIQFLVLRTESGLYPVDLDEISLVRREPAARFEPEYEEKVAWANAGDVAVPIKLVNPTNRDRRYRFFVSSELGASRQVLNRALAEADSIGAPTAVQKAVGANGGLSAAFLTDENGRSVRHREIEIGAGGEWRGTLVHRIRPEMLGQPVTVRYRGHIWTARRDTLTTSVIAWDPDEPRGAGMGWIRVAPSNADDASHPVPMGFPLPERPPQGWRSGDVPPEQVGAYLVTELTLR